MAVIPSNPYNLAPGNTTQAKLDVAFYATWMIEITGGSFKFNADGEINANTPTYSDGDKVAFDSNSGFYYQDQTGSSTASVSYVR